MDMHKGKHGFVVGIANEHSIAARFDRVFKKACAELTVTYYETESEPYVEPVAKDMGGHDFHADGC